MIYEKPRLIVLDREQPGHGVCSVGSGETTGACLDGGGASGPGACSGGAGAQGSCNDGSAASANCGFGTTAFQ